MRRAVRSCGGESIRRIMSRVRPPDRNLQPILWHGSIGSSNRSSDRARTLSPVNARPGWDADLAPLTKQTMHRDISSTADRPRAEVGGQTDTVLLPSPLPAHTKALPIPSSNGFDFTEFLGCHVVAMHPIGIGSARLKLTTILQRQTRHAYLICFSVVGSDHTRRSRVSEFNSSRFTSDGIAGARDHRQRWKCRWSHHSFLAVG
jgi:hypothetical protein